MPQSAVTAISNNNEGHNLYRQECRHGPPTQASTTYTVQQLCELLAKLGMYLCMYVCVCVGGHFNQTQQK